MFRRASCLGVILMFLLALAVLLTPVMEPAAVVPGDMAAFTEISDITAIVSALEPALERLDWSAMEDLPFGNFFDSFGSNTRVTRRSGKGLLPFLRLGIGLMKDPDSLKPEPIIIISAGAITRFFLQTGLRLSAVSPFVQSTKTVAPDGSRYRTIISDDGAIHYVSGRDALYMSPSVAALWAFMCSGAPALSDVDEYQEYSGLMPANSALWVYMSSSLLMPAGLPPTGISDTIAMVLVPSEFSGLRWRIYGGTDEGNLDLLLDNIAVWLRSMSGTGRNIGQIGYPLFNLQFNYEISNDYIRIYDRMPRGREDISRDFKAVNSVHENALSIDLHRPALNTLLKGLFMVSGMMPHPVIDDIESAHLYLVDVKHALCVEINIYFREVA